MWRYSKLTTSRSSASRSGSEYLVDTREGRCECDDHHYRGVRCKHLRRVAFATGDETIPAGVDGVDPQLGEHTDETPRRAAPDGGVVKTTDTRTNATTATSAHLSATVATGIRGLTCRVGPAIPTDRSIDTLQVA